MNLSSVLRQINNALTTAREALRVGWAEPPKRTTDLWLDYYHKSPMLDPVHMIATDVAGTPYKIFNKFQYRKDPQNAEPIVDNPILDLLDHPMSDHPEIDAFQILYLTDVYHEIIGDAFWMIDKDMRGRPVGLYPIPPTWVLLTPTATQPYFRIQPMGNTSHRGFDVSPADMVWFKSPNAANPYGRGRARAESIGDETETHEYSSKYAKNFFYNDATPPLIFEMPGISKTAADEFKESWMQKIGGYLNARKPGIVAQKDFKVHQLATSQKEMDFTESRKYLIQMANEHFCVPPEMRGNLQNSNRATIDSAYYLWSKNVVTKRLRAFASVLNGQFVPMFGKDLIWKFDDIIPEDNAAKMQIANDGMEKGTITLNEWRKIATSCGVQLAPDEKRGDVYLRGLMIQEVPANDEPEEPTEPVPVEEPEEIDLGKAIAELEARTKGLHKYTRVYSEAEKVSIWKAFDKTATAQEKPFITSVKKFSDVQSKRVKSAIEDAEMLDEINAGLDKIFTKESDEALKRSLAPAWLSSMRAGRENAIKLLKKSASEDVVNDLFNKWVDKAGLKKAKEINETTSAKLRKRIAESIDAGQSIQNQITNILAVCDETYQEMSTTRAELIARTETASTVNYGAFETYKIEGQVERKEWLAVRDKRTRDAHSVVDGQIRKIDEPFDVGGEQLMFPGDPNGSAANNCNERCTFAPYWEE